MKTTTILAVIGFNIMGLQIPSGSPTIVKLGNLSDPLLLLGAGAFISMIVMEKMKIKGNIIIAIIAFSVIAWVFGLGKFNGVVSAPPPMTHLLDFDLGAALSASMVTVIFTLFFIDFFDTAATLTGVANVAKKIGRDGKIVDIKDIIITEANRKRKKDKEYVNEKEYVLETDGTNLLGAMVSELSDETRCISNDIVEIYDILGIEATRALLIDEVTGVVKHEGEYINSRHIEVLCDVMTSRGILISINRQGINRGDIGPLAKCSFEDTTDQLIKASIFGEKDKLNGVSSNIMMGQTIHAGTGLCNILLDEDKLIHEMKDINLTQDDFIEVTDNNIHSLLDDVNQEEDDYCNDEDFNFSI